MPAPPSSLIDPVIGHLADLAGGAAGAAPSLLAVLGTWLTRRRPLPDPHRQRPARHGQPAQPGHHHLATVRGDQYRRRPALPRPASKPPPANDHGVLNDFAGALIMHIP
jgi:hypothetical protein